MLAPSPFTIKPETEIHNELNDTKKAISAYLKLLVSEI